MERSIHVNRIQTDKPFALPFFSDSSDVISNQSRTFRRRENSEAILCSVQILNSKGCIQLRDMQHWVLKETVSLVYVTLF
jgi:hypothetical protein